jgi:hypothetical protein
MTMLAPAGVRDEIEGDLTERFSALRARGALIAHLWLIGQLARMRPRELQRVREGGGMGDSGWGADVRHALRSVSQTCVVTSLGLVFGRQQVRQVVPQPLVTPDVRRNPANLLRKQKTEPELANDNTGPAKSKIC